MEIVTLDFETYFDKDYSLKKLTTEGYVRDPRFEVLFIGARSPDGGNYILRGENIPSEISTKAVLCHHAHFDGLILSHHYGVSPAFWFDTLSMARCAFPHDKSHSLESLAHKFGLAPKTVPYDKFIGKRSGEITFELYRELAEGCLWDTELTYNIFQKLLPLVPKEELKVIDLTIRMFTEPTLRLDRELVTNYMEELQQKQEAVLGQVGAKLTDLRSADKFANILSSMGVEPPTKISPTTGKTTYAFAKTDQGFLELVNHEAEDIRLLAEARLNTKSTLGETRAGRLLEMHKRGTLCVYLKYYGAHTGRWSGGDKLNFQNFPRGGDLRKSLLAPDGHTLCVMDLSQIECRVLNHLAGEAWVLDAFRENRDLYSEMASDFYGYKVNKKDHPKERFLGKTLVLGAGYGIGWKKLQAMLKLNKVVLSEQDARRAIDRYRGKHKNVVNLWQVADWCLKWMVNGNPRGGVFEYDLGCVKIRGKKVILPNGAIMDYSGLRRGKDGIELVTGRGITNMYGGKFIENIVQALARIVMAQAMLKISKIYKIVTTTHDEIVYIAPKGEAEIALEIGYSILVTPPLWAPDLPLDAEGGADERYSK